MSAGLKVQVKVDKNRSTPYVIRAYGLRRACVRSRSHPHPNQTIPLGGEGGVERQTPDHTYTYIHISTRLHDGFWGGVMSTESLNTMSRTNE